jgi:hypothetical protein
MTRKRPRLWSALLILILVGGLIFWWANAQTNEDPLWFLSSFKAQADWITVYWDGRITMFFPGDPEYDTVMAAFADAIGHCSGYEGSVAMSDEGLEHYRGEGRLLELHYNQPARVHTRHPYPEAHTFFVPLSGTHAEWQRVFAGLADTPRTGVLNFSNARYATLYEAVELTVLRYQPQSQSEASHTSG